MNDEQVAREAADAFWETVMKPNRNTLTSTEAAVARVAATQAFIAGWRKKGEALTAMFDAGANFNEPDA